MTDEELAAYLGFSKDETHLVAKLDPLKRATFERMHEVEIELNLWQAGLGPKPAGVIITPDRRRKK